MKGIQMTFDITGEIKVQMFGFSGKTCKDASVFIEETLGEVKSIKRTSDYYKTKTMTQIKQKNG